MNKISIICCFNKENIYKNILIKSLEKQNFLDYELIGINNTNGQFHSAAQALNWGVEQATTENLLFVHQDFEFLSCNSLEEVYQCFKKLKNEDILGAAGAMIDKNAGIVQKLIGRNRKNYSTLGNIGFKWNNWKEVSTLDECCFGCHKEFWNDHHFNDRLCTAWDLYAVELCLYASLTGGHCYVIPMHAIHYSGGNLSNAFYKTLLNISKAYHKKISMIVTTCVVANTKYPYINYIKFLLINKLRDTLWQMIKEHNK